MTQENNVSQTLSPQGDKLKFAVITPSYAPDFERCKLLCKSLQRFAVSPYTHYIVVDQRDLHLFQALKDDNTKIMTVESIIPKWIKRFPWGGQKNIWVSFKTLPVRGWILQQVVKIAISLQVQEEFLLFLDSDVFLVKEIDFCTSFIRQNKLRLFRQNILSNSEAIFNNLNGTMSRLLGLPIEDCQAGQHDYIGSAILWRRSNLEQLCQFVENVSGKPWTEAICNHWHFSEYQLYGTFVDKILQHDSGHYHDDKLRVLQYGYSAEYGEPEPLSEYELRNLFSKVLPEHFAIMISAKSGTPVKYCSHLLDELAHKQSFALDRF